MSRDYKWDWDNLSEKDKQSLQELYQLKYNLVLDLYRRRARRIEAVHVREHNITQLADWEYYCYKIFGSRLMGSLAFSLDPYWQTVDLSNPAFGVPKKFLEYLKPTVVTPVNRHATFTAILPSQTLFKETKRNLASSSSLVFSGGKFSESGMKTVVSVQNFSSASVPFQDEVKGYKHDTTWKTRNPGKKVSRKTLKKLPFKEGEFELFVPAISASTVSYGYKAMQSRIAVVQAVGFPTPPTLHTFEDDYWYGHTTGPTCTISNATCQAYYLAEHTYGRSLMVKHLDRMMAQTVPNRRYFNLGYQIGELKDVPFSIKSTLRSWRECQRLMSTDVFKEAYISSKWWTRHNIALYRPALLKIYTVSDLDKTAAELYLNFKFGWDSLFSAIRKMLDSPKRAADDINNIIKRNGKFSNLSYQIGWSEPVDPPPTLGLPTSTVILSKDDAHHPASIVATRDLSLRVVTHTGINFPDIDKPSFKMKLFLDKMGLIPTPADAYDLIPWTWMIDWFTGATDYIHLMDRVNGNKDLIDYSLITYKSLTRVVGVRELFGVSTVGWKNVPPDSGVDPLHTEQYTTWVNISGEVRLKYELRLSVASLVNVKDYSGRNLSDDQKTILGSLLAIYGP